MLVGAFSGMVSEILEVSFGWLGLTSRIHRNCHFLETHSDPKKDTARNELTPVLGECGTERCKKTENGSEEDCTTATQDVVQGIGKPSDAINKYMSE